MLCCVEVQWDRDRRFVPACGVSRGRGLRATGRCRRAARCVKVVVVGAVRLGDSVEKRQLRAGRQSFAKWRASQFHACRSAGTRARAHEITVRRLSRLVLCLPGLGPRSARAAAGRSPARRPRAREVARAALRVSRRQQRPRARGGTSSRRCDSPASSRCQNGVRSTCVRRVAQNTHRARREDPRTPRRRETACVCARCA